MSWELWGLGKPPDPATVVHDYGPAVHRHLRRIFGPHTDVDDVYQATFVEILRSLPNFRGRAKLSTWIRRITWNVAYQEMRTFYQQKRFVPLDATIDELTVDPNAEEHAARRQALSRLYDSLGKLPPRQRMVVIMHDIDGLTLREISQTLGRPLQTVASQLHAGRKKLADWIENAISQPGTTATTRTKTGGKAKRP